MEGATFAASRGKDGVPNTVRILPRGIKTEHGQPQMRIRFYFENFETGTWTMQLHHQWIGYPPSPDRIAATPSPDFPASGPAKIAPGASRLLELRFPIPTGVSRNWDLDSFVLTWEVVTPTKTLTDTTTFVLEERDDPDDTNSPLVHRGGGRRGGH